MKLRNSALIIVFIALCLVSCATKESEDKEKNQFTTEKLAEKITTEELTMEESTTEEPTTEEPTTQEPTTEAPKDSDFVKVKEYIPDISIDLRYATDNNFTNQKIYEFSEAWLRYGTVKKLMVAQEILKEQGYSLELLDGFRPVSAQFRLWEVFPNGTFVANPTVGYSSHSRGNTVDITLVHLDGTDALMPTEFDTFSAMADRNYSDCEPEAAANAKLLEDVLKECGFIPYYAEWWHFQDSQVYDVEKVFDPATMNEYKSVKSD